MRIPGSTSVLPTASTQVADIEAWIDQGAEAICVFPVDPSTMTALQQRAQAAGIRWIGHAETLPGADGAVLLSLQESGQIAADDAVRWIQQQERAAEVAVPDASTIPEISARTDVPIAEIEHRTDARIVAQDNAIDQEGGLRIMENILQGHPEVRVVIGANDDGALEAVKAFENAGIDPGSVHVGGQDGALEALGSIRSGGCRKASVSVDIAVVGRAVVDSAVVSITRRSETTIDVSPVLGSRSEPAVLDQLIAQLT